MGVGGLREWRLRRDLLGSDRWRVDSCSPGEVFRGDKRVSTSMGVAAASACSVGAFSGDCVPAGIGGRAALNRFQQGSYLNNVDTSG